ncbi:MAG: DUF4157 domain-containing protein, partial [Acidobacteriota bacterium]
NDAVNNLDPTGSYWVPWFCGKIPGWHWDPSIQDEVQNTRCFWYWQEVRSTGGAGANVNQGKGRPSSIPGFPYGPKSQPVAPCIKSFLGPFFEALNTMYPGMGFDIDFSKVRIHPYGLPDSVETFAWFDPGAFTWGNDIYFPQGGYDPNRIDSDTIGLVAHELTHVAQFNRLGEVDFAHLYILFAFLGRIPYPFNGMKATYVWNPLEWEAENFEQFIRQYLKQLESSSEDAPCQ